MDDDINIVSIINSIFSGLYELRNVTTGEVLGVGCYSDMLELYNNDHSHDALYDTLRIRKVKTTAAKVLFDK